jgi:hypothetical protein
MLHKKLAILTCKRPPYSLDLNLNLIQNALEAHVRYLQFYDCDKPFKSYTDQRKSKLEVLIKL